ncbi:hypothetical protein [Roseovarius aestuariivivens]|uniref:hypothetical protein n=1 Tax=Roseovarius aestuariivivens TaxID=1888910 RepID=UPI00107FEEC0|nr:hypothetical protein [Roseovarius aestuariivivens]
MNFIAPLAALTMALSMAMTASAAWAEAFTADGVAKGQSSTEIIELTGDHTVMNSRISYSAFEMEDETNPMNQLKGPCFGVLEARGAAMQGNGVCVLEGLEGDQVVLGWVARRMDPQGRIAGYWTVNHGTGTWLQASGGGTFLSSVNPANGAATNTLKGAITLR